MEVFVLNWRVYVTTLNNVLLTAETIIYVD